MEDGGWEMELLVPRIELDRLLSTDRSLMSRLMSKGSDLAVANG
jgi:hypothetical protein